MTEYEKLLSRIDKAEAWLNAPERTEEEKEKYYPEFKKIVDRASYMEARGMR